MSATFVSESTAKRIAIGGPAVMLLLCAFTYSSLDETAIRIAVIAATIVVVALCGALGGMQQRKE